MFMLSFIMYPFFGRIREDSNKPRKEFVPKPRASIDLSENHNGNIGHSGPSRSPGKAII